MLNFSLWGYQKLKLAMLELIYTDAVVVANNVTPKQWLNMNRIILHKSDSTRWMIDRQAHKVCPVNPKETFHKAIWTSIYIAACKIYQNIKFYKTEIATGLLCQLKVIYQKYMWLDFGKLIEMWYLTYSILFPQLIAMLIHYPCTVALPSLADWMSAFLDLECICFDDHVKWWLRQWGSWRALDGRYGSDIHPWVSEASLRLPRLIWTYA